MNQWIVEYIRAQKVAHDSIPCEAVAQLIEKLRVALREDRQIFVFGNGGSAANASHFATDLGKLASDKVGQRFRVLSLNDNVGWLTALANDYAYEDVFAGQLQNYGRAGDLALGLSVSGNSPNCVKAIEWAKAHGLRTVALVGAGAWPRLPSRLLSSTTHTMGGWRTRRWASATCCATRSWKSRSWAGSRSLLRQLAVHGLTEHVEEQFLAFLNARSRGARDYQVQGSDSFGKAAVTTKEANALHLLFVGLF